MIKPLSDEVIRIINDKAEEEYEDVEMTDAEWEEKRWSIIAQEAQRDTLMQVVEFLALHQGSSEPIEEEVPYFGSKVRLVLCRRFRLQEVDWQELRKLAEKL